MQECKSSNACFIDKKTHRCASGTKMTQTMHARAQDKNIVVNVKARISITACNVDDDEVLWRRHFQTWASRDCPKKKSNNEQQFADDAFS
jgi:hypothetical protein